MSTEMGQADLAFGDFTIDRGDERLLGPHGPVKLGNKAYRVLLSLAEQDGRLLTKDALFTSVWDGTVVSESALTSVIKELRRALGDESRTPRFIESVYGRGYRFVAPVGLATERDIPAPILAAETARPPLVLVSAFNDDAIRERHPHCAAGLREEVLSGLARFREIQLVADGRTEREAEASYQRPSDRDYQLTATLLPEGDGVKVIARAKRLAGGRIVWAETMSLADTGTARGVEKIVRRIVGAALPAVDDDLFLALPDETDDFYDSYLIAKRRSLTATSYAEARQAADALERVIAERPDFALAYPPLVRLYNTDFGYTGLGSTGQRERAHALGLAKAGLAADRGNVHAYTVLGFCHLWHGDHDRARDCFDQALTLNPYNPTRIQEVASGWMYMGDLVAARALVDRASELNPFPDDNFYEVSGRLRLIEGDYDGACAMLESIARGTVWAGLYLAICAFRLDPGDIERFAAWRRRVNADWHSTPPPSVAEVVAWIKLHHPLPASVANRVFEGIEDPLCAAGAMSTPTLEASPLMKQV